MKSICIKCKYQNQCFMSLVEHPYYFVYWIDLMGVNDPYESIGEYHLELLKVSVRTGILQDPEQLPVAMTKNSIFRINQYRKAKTQNTIGVVFSIEDIMSSPVKVSGESHYRQMTFDEFRQTGQESLAVKKLRDISECAAIFVYMSSIEVEFIHFMLRHPFTFADVVRVYTYSRKYIITQSLLYHVIKMFQSMNLELPLVFCVKAKTEPFSHQTVVGTEDYDDDSE